MADLSAKTPVLKLAEDAQRLLGPRQAASLACSRASQKVASTGKFFEIFDPATFFVSDFPLSSLFRDWISSSISVKSKEWLMGDDSESTLHPRCLLSPVEELCGMTGSITFTSAGTSLLEVAQLGGAGRRVERDCLCLLALL